ncbi:MAG: LysR family transcriptional regulator, partial [Pseudohongiellaceae bacterium]
MRLNQLNYKHLQYFYLVAREGGVNNAAKLLHVTPQTISGQITQLEDVLGVRLFVKSGRALHLSPAGKLAYRYAHDIFALGEQLLLSLQDDAVGARQRIVIGILDSVPKTIAYRILQPALGSGSQVMTCVEGDLDDLMADLAVHKVDMVLSDLPVRNNYSIKCYSHFLGESSLSCFGTASLAARCRRGFPASLEGIPMLLPREKSQLGRELHRWLQQQPWRPAVRGHFDDSALLKAFGQAGGGVFFMPTV